MISFWEKFTAVEHQIEIDYVEVLRRSRGVLVAEIGTSQKYAEVLAYSGTELLLKASEMTPAHSYDENAEATSVVFPVRLRGWDAVVPCSGRYAVRNSALCVVNSARTLALGGLIDWTTWASGCSGCSQPAAPARTNYTSVCRHSRSSILLSQHSANGMG